MAETAQSIGARAQLAMQEGRLDEALVDLSTLKLLLPNDATIWLMVAFANRAKGELEEAREHFETASRMAPDDANIRFEFAKFLDQIGEYLASSEQYDHVLRITPGHADSLIDQALVLAKTSKRPAALEQLRSVANQLPDLLRAWNNLAVLLREDFEFEEAEAAANHVLERDPNNARAAHILAQCAFDKGEKSSDLFIKARGIAPDNLDLLSSEAGALVQEDQPEKAIALLEDQLAKDPLWVGGHRMLADVRWQLTGGEDFIQSYKTVLEGNPKALDLWSNCIITVSRALGHDYAMKLIDDAKKHNPDEIAFDILAAHGYSELEDFDQAAALFGKFDCTAHPATQLYYVRFLIKSRQYEQAEKWGLDLVERGAGSDAWPFVSIAWRKQDNPRWGWLEGDHDFVQSFDLAEMPDELPPLAEKLRDMHKFQVHPFAQSLRGGTQTDGVLFSKQVPEIQSLVGHLRRTIRQYLDELPAYDANHPLLSMNRDTFRFTGSWSVRLTGSGFHVNHIHNQGNLSSAFYVTVPETIGSGDSGHEEGWLAVGEPATELNTGLSAVKTVEPKPGRLVLFPSTMWHGTRPFGAGERMSCAFDVGLFKD